MAPPLSEVQQVHIFRQLEIILLEPKLFEYKYSVNLKPPHFALNRISRCRLETSVHRPHACFITDLNKSGETHRPNTHLTHERVNVTYPALDPFEVFKFQSINAVQ